MNHSLGIFERNGYFYMRYVVPTGQQKLFNGRTRLVKSLHTKSLKEARVAALLERAKYQSVASHTSEYFTPNPSHNQASASDLRLLDIYGQWLAAKPRTTDSQRACRLALDELMELLGTNAQLAALTRADGLAFRSTLLASCKALKTAHGKLTWIKSLLNFAHVELAVTTHNPWRGINIQYSKASSRRPWTDAEIAALLALPIWQQDEIPKARGAGGQAAKWLPLLAMYTGARLSELAQLTPTDIQPDNGGFSLVITDKGSGQKLKTVNAKRRIPIHSKLIDLGFLRHVERCRAGGESSVWPSLPVRNDKAGGYFSNWFGRYLKANSFAVGLDFHSFRHTVRTKMAINNTPETVMDTLLGHSLGGSTGKSRYSHVTQHVRPFIERLRYETDSKD